MEKAKRWAVTSSFHLVPASKAIPKTSQMGRYKIWEHGLLPMHLPGTPPPIFSPSTSFLYLLASSVFSGNNTWLAFHYEVLFTEPLAGSRARGSLIIGLKSLFRSCFAWQVGDPLTHCRLLGVGALMIMLHF